MMRHGRAEAAGRTFLDGDQHFVMACQLADQLRIQRFHEAGIGDGGGETTCGQLVGGFQRVGQARAQGQDGDFAAFPENAAFADLPHRAARGQATPRPSPRG